MDTYRNTSKTPTEIVYIDDQGVEAVLVVGAGADLTAPSDSPAGKVAAKKLTKDKDT